MISCVQCSKRISDNNIPTITAYIRKVVMPRHFCSLECREAFKKRLVKCDYCGICYIKNKGYTHVNIAQKDRVHLFCTKEHKRMWIEDEYERVTK